MYTKRSKAKKISLQSADHPTVLGTTIAAAVHGQAAYLLELIVKYLGCDRAEDMSELARLLLRALGEIQVREELTDQQTKIVERASEELRKSQGEFRAAMTWLCLPKNSDPHARVGRELLASGRWQPGRYPSIDKRSEEFVRYFETHLKHFKVHLSLQEGRLLSSPLFVHYVDLFCACVLDRCLGRNVSEFPIRICPKCGTIFLSERKQFCSEKCQWSHYWTKERRADDKWIKDLEKFSRTCKPEYGRSVEDLRQKLASPNVEQRLQSIKQKAKTEEWAGWSKILKRLEAVESQAKECD